MRGTTVVSIAPSRIRSRHDRALEQVGAELREDPPAADVADRVAGAADPLQAARDRLRRLDLDHEVDRAHVDPELERRGRDEARQLAGLEHLLDDRPLLARQRAVVGAGDLALGELVEPQRQPLGRAAVVDEQDRRAVGLDQLEQLGVDRRPDRAPRRLGAAGQRVQVGAPGVASGSTIDSTGTWISRSSSLRTPVSTIRHVRRRPDQEPPDLLERLLRRRQADPLDVAAGGLREPLERQRQVRAALGRGDRVDLVDDAPPAPANSSWARPVSIRYSDSGVVIRMSGGWRSIAWRSRCGVSPVRTATFRSAPIPRSGARRLRSMS